MFCTKCGRKGFPARIACAVCNTTLPDVPAILETPDQRANPKQVTCVKCGSIASDARIACTHCDASFPRPFRFSDEGPFTPDPRIGYYNFVCSAAACAECKRFDGLYFLPSELRQYRIPVSTCQYPVCWCEIVGVCFDEGMILTSGAGGAEARYLQPGSAADILGLLGRSSGVATKQEIDAHIEAQLRPQREKRAREHANVDVWLRAYRLEKESPEQSISLYRESIQAWKAALRAEPTSRWDYLDDCYNRLTLLLERSKRVTEALREIDDYHAFSSEMARRAQMETIVKREARLRKRILKSQ
jgi:hypothetical protein